MTDEEIENLIKLELFDTFAPGGLAFAITNIVRTCIHRTLGERRDETLKEHAACEDMPLTGLVKLYRAGRGLFLSLDAAVAARREVYDRTGVRIGLDMGPLTLYADDPDSNFQTLLKLAASGSEGE